MQNLCSSKVVTTKLPYSQGYSPLLQTQFFNVPQPRDLDTMYAIIQVVFQNIGRSTRYWVCKRVGSYMISTILLMLLKESLNDYPTDSPPPPLPSHKVDGILLVCVLFGHYLLIISSSSLPASTNYSRLLWPSFACAVKTCSGKTFLL